MAFVHLGITLVMLQYPMRFSGQFTALHRLLSGPAPFFALRQGLGVLLPIIFFIGLLQTYDIGFAFSAGALAVALIDQPGGTKSFRRKEMAFIVIAGNLAALITSLSVPYPAIIWLVISAQVFAFSMLSVFGKRGGLVGFACLLMMFLSLNLDIHQQGTGYEHFIYHAITLGGSLYYFLLSLSVSYLFRLHEERLTLSAAVYATAEYLYTRGEFYDVTKDLDDCFRRSLPRLISMTDSHQAARDQVLGNLPEDYQDHQRQRIVLWNVFIEMIALLDTMVASQTDYALLRDRFKDDDVLLFMRDTLYKLSRTLQRCAFALANNKAVEYRNSVKAELRAIEYELAQLKQAGVDKSAPDVYSLLMQILRRLRNAAHYVDIIADTLRPGGELKPIDSMRRDKSLLQFRNHQSLRLQPIVHNLRWSSPIFRYALRVTIAILLVQVLTNSIVLALSDVPLIQKLIEHSHWITITILITMRPGFALTRERTLLRLQGTFLGCLLTLALFSLTTHPVVLLVLMLAAMIAGQALILHHFRLGSLFVTMYVLIGFYFISPNIFTIIGERAIDTAIACAIAFACSFAFPWWEENQIKKLATATIAASREYLQKELRFIQSVIDIPQHRSEDYPSNPHYVALQLARRNMHNSYAALADSYARMLHEPRSHHDHIGNFNSLIMSLNTMASQISSLSPLFLAQTRLDPSLLTQFDYVDAVLNLPEEAQTHPPTLQANDDNMPFMFPVKQMVKAAQVIRKESQLIALLTPTEAQNA